MNKLISLVALLGGMVLSAPSWALVIEGTEVGGLDTVLASDFVHPPNNANELAWADSVIPGGSIYETKNDALSWLWDGGSIYALELITAPEYFLLKLGSGGVDANMVMYTNEDLLQWAVIDLDVLSRVVGETIDIGRISHVSEFNGTNEVPEPATVALLGLGLIGMGIARRRRKA